MMEYSNQNITLKFAEDMININKIAKQQEITIDTLRLKAAMYKAYFFNRYELAEKLQNQIMENYHHCVGEFDGFCYMSRRRDAEYRTLEDMHIYDLITDEEYKFCNV